MNLCLRHSDCLYNIFYWLDLKCLLTCFEVCKYFLEQGQNEMLWKNIYNYNVECHNNYYNTFKKYYHFDHFMKNHINCSLNDLLPGKLLYLYNKNINILPNEIGLLTNLENLGIEHNRLTSLPYTINNCKKLISLRLYNNYFTKLPNLSSLLNLKYLSLAFNKLTSLDSIGQYKQLKELNLNSNELTTLPLTIGNLHQLQYLNISHNKLLTLPSEIGQCQALKYLYIHNNHFITLPQELTQCKNLRQIHINSCDQLLLPEFDDHVQIFYIEDVM